jgi:hypothetical protein
MTISLNENRDIGRASARPAFTPGEMLATEVRRFTLRLGYSKIGCPRNPES